MIDSRFRVLHSEKGRANQMNLVAKESSGDILFFLHSDSELPKHPLAEIRYVMKDHLAGCFGMHFIQSISLCGRAVSFPITGSKTARSCLEIRESS